MPPSAATITLPNSTSLKSQMANAEKKAMASVFQETLRLVNRKTIPMIAEIWNRRPVSSNRIKKTLRPIR